MTDTATETGTFTPTDEDVAALAAALGDRISEADHRRRIARDALTLLGPIIERERRAAKAEALRGWADLWESEHLSPADVEAGTELSEANHARHFANTLLSWPNPVANGIERDA